MEADLIVVGAGPAGSMAALAAARAGRRVALIDKKSAGGEPVQCAEGVSRFASESDGLRPDPKYVREAIQGAPAVLPDREPVDIPPLPVDPVGRGAVDR